jgi:dipeptidyl-peptidase-4
VTQEERVLVPAEQVPPSYRQFWFNADAAQILWAVNYRKQYRYSYFANYLVQNVATGEIAPLVADQDFDVQYAVWSPSATDNTIAYVRGNNIFIWTNGTTTQVTNNGGPDLFNGVPDWVYEEEIVGQNYVMWFNDEGDKLVYLTTNETGVPTFTVQYWMNHTDPAASVALSYPDELDIRYPKVGATNPTIAANLLDLNWGTDGPAPQSLPVTGFDQSELIIGEVAWLDTQIAVRVYNRVQSQSKLWLYDTTTGDSRATREQDGSDGWLDNHMSITYIGNGEFVDQDDLSGFDHFYRYSINDTSSPVALTKGDFEVRALLYVDQEKRIAYYTSTEVHATESHVFGVSLDTGEAFNLTDISQPGFWSASFTQNGNFYVLTYSGPNVPFQQLYASNDTTTPIRTINNNSALVTSLEEYKLPTIEYVDLESPSGFTLSGMIRYPAKFDPSRKYPVLFTPYGGPGAQEVTKRMQAFDFNSYISADPELEYITFTLDGRGTGFRGRAHRASVNRHLGEFEAEDQIWAAQEISRRYSFIDTSKIQIWGWSFGGYLSAKVVEADSGVFSQALITAPVSDWRLYDSMYTERYMGLPSDNEDGYTRTAVRNVAGFKNITGGVLIQHGTGDDNVHFQVCLHPR